jgi:hypothetical protein
LRLKTRQGGFQQLSQEPETMKTAKAGTPGFAAPSSYVPPHYLRRVARSIVLRAAMRGRLAWHVALPVLNHLGGQEVQR